MKINSRSIKKYIITSVKFKGETVPMTTEVKRIKKKDLITITFPIYENKQS